MALPDINITELQNALKIVPAGADDVQVIIGCSSQGQTLTPAAYATIPGLVADFGHGPLVEEAAQSILQSQGTPVIVIRTPNSTPGTVGTIDTSDKTGSATFAAQGAPHDAYEVYLAVVNEGTVGTAGITFQWSLDGGRTLSAVTALGTSTTFTIPDSGVTIDFVGLVACTNAIKAAFNAHVVKTTGSVHGATDNANVVSVANATDNTTSIPLLNALRTSYEAHRVLTSSVHGAADSTNAITAPAATNLASALTLAADLRTKFNAHVVNVTGSVHGAADTANVVSQAAPVLGTLNKGDEIRFQTTAPKWATDDVADAFTALVNGQQDFGFIQVVGPMTSSEVASVSTGLDTLRAAHKYAWAIVGARLPEEDETEVEWMGALESEYASIVRSDIAMCAGTWRVTSAVSGRQHTRPVTGAVAARMVQIPIYVDAAKVSLGPLDEGTLFDSNRNLIGHDESKALGLDAARFITLRTFPTRGVEVYITNPKLMSAAGSDFDLVQKRRVMNVLERTVYDFGLTFDLNEEGTADPETGFISETAARDIEEEMRTAIRDALGPAISNPDSEQLFILSRTDPVLTNGGVLNASSRIEPLFYIKNLRVTAGFTAGAGG